MYQIEHEKKETITVLHQNEEKRREDAVKLTAEGWTSLGVASNTVEVPERDIPNFKERYPDIEITYPKATSHLHFHPYVHTSRWERSIN